MRVFLAAMLLVVASTPAAAEKWYYVSERGDEGDLIVLADADSVRQTGEAVSVLAFAGSDWPLDFIGKPPVDIWYQIKQFEFLCSSGQYRTTRTDSYDEFRVLRYSTNHNDAWAPVPPESIVYGLRQFACEGTRFAESGDPFDFTDEVFFGPDK
ncbi:MAG: hypothetical protein APF82_07305 [Sphingomonadales bacterium BRH_c42]|nr:MAG: hypothetical protein APF82_07305 [Sphingomonadales bacterium BRH_c42]